MYHYRLLRSLLVLTFVFCSSLALSGEFNQEEKDTRKNGNVRVAIEKLQTVTPEELDKSAQVVPLSEVTKKIYQVLGKTIKIRGKVWQVEELRPRADLPGTWTQVLMMAKNPNASMGVMTVEFLYKGDSSRISPRDIVTCSGYFAGMYNSQNAYGGTVEGIMLVGNHFKKDK